ncbi:MFS transporter [Pelomonas aquatica]|uniref:MFS transporter n=1 Tax=Pelomonas aquatica TaxID=431058 RepID=A0A9X4LQR4_9BURK|nr:MFS transporter [Pelomonas aquatica]MCY4754568.1 MFS transporter [Pelomonas aquatica]MDG0864773.1 MFS transporter [Pelomonas aquatica]
MSEGAPPKRHLRHAFAWLIATLICVHASMAVTRVTAALWVLNHGYGEASVGLLLSLFAVAPIALSLWAGRLADRHGFHRPVGVGVTLAFAGALLALAVQQLWAIAIGCLFCGGAIAVAAVAMQREAGMMADQPGELKRIFSWMALGPALSNSLAPIVAGLLIDHVGMTAAFGFATLLPLLAWGLAQKVPRHAPEPVTQSYREPAAWGLFRLPAFRRLMLVNLVLSACWDAHSFVVPVVGHARGLSASSIGVVLGSFAVAATCVRLAIVRFADDLHEVKALRTAMVVAMLTFLGYAWLPGTAGLMAGSALLGVALGSVQPMILAMLHRVTPPERHGQALGLRMLAVNGATVAMPAGFGLLAAATALAAPMWLMAALLLLAQAPARRL